MDELQWLPSLLRLRLGNLPSKKPDIFQEFPEGTKYSRMRASCGAEAWGGVAGSGLPG